MIWRTLPRFETDPFGEIGRLQREFDRFFTGRPSRGSDFPAVNVWANADRAVVTAEVPGVDPQDIELSVTGNRLTLQGDRPADSAGDNESYLRKERGDGRFARTVTLPFALEADQVEARVANGVLTVTLPRHEATKPRQVKVVSA